MNFVAQLLIIAAVGSGSRIALEEQRHYNVPPEWNLLGRAAAEQKLQLIFAVTQNASGVTELEKVLLSVSDPRSSAYGKHISNEAVHEMVRPSVEHAAAVHDFLKMYVPPYRVLPVYATPLT
jgi:hypothetical protein